MREKGDYREKIKGKKLQTKGKKKGKKGRGKGENKGKGEERREEEEMVRQVWRTDERIGIKEGGREVLDKEGRSR